MAAPPARFVPNARVVLVDGATHWVQQDAPARVSELLLEHFGADPATLHPSATA
jgi:pimeloyl-ACP methyl ester carboxylesterase